MNPRLVLRRVLCGGGALLLLALSWWTLSSGVRNVRQVMNLGQEVETTIQLVGGLLCLAVVVTRFWWRPAARPLRIAWMATQAVWVALSALVWGAPQPLIALLFAAVSLLLAWGLLWALGPAVA